MNDPAAQAPKLGHGASSPERPGVPGTLLFENDRTRVWELVMKPGEACNWHVHEYDHLLVVVDGCKVEAVRPGGVRSERDIPDNTVLFIPRSLVPEIARNCSSDRTLREIIIDLKDPSAFASTVALFEFFRPGTATTTFTARLGEQGVL